MSWKNIKTFLILLFVIINAYLIFSTNGMIFKKSTVTYFNKDTIEDAAKVAKTNFNVSLSADIVPTQVKNLKNLSVTNLIYTDKFKNSDYNPTIIGAGFEINIKTNTFSYNEKNAKEQVEKILDEIGISKETFVLKSYKADEGLVCNASQVIGDYPLFNGRIKAVCVSSKITVSGTWYITETHAKANPLAKMADLTSVIIDAADRFEKSDGSKTVITSVDYGYYVTSHDESIVSKSSPAIPCYMVKTDGGLKYYYDATNGKAIKQED